MYLIQKTITGQAELIVTRKEERIFDPKDRRYWNCAMCGKETHIGTGYRGRLFCGLCVPRKAERDPAFKKFISWRFK